MLFGTGHQTPTSGAADRTSDPRTMRGPAWFGPWRPSLAATSVTAMQAPSSKTAPTLRRAISEGEEGPGERLPPAGDLAAVLEVNRNTVLRALRLLRDEGLLEFRRGRGITVSGGPDRTEIVQRARELVELAGRYGYGIDELVQLVRHLSGPA
jgi:DNA-binding GntR family transcriptional regulator